MFFSQAGCLLPFLIMANLFFGWIFLKPGHWLLVEVILVALFLINSIILTRKVFSGTKKYDNVIDTEGEVVDRE